MGAHSRVSRSRSTMRRIAGGGALGVVAVGSVVGGAGVASAEQTVGSHGITVTVPDGCDIYLQAGLAGQFPDSGHTQRCLAEKGLSGPAVTDVSTVPASDDSGSSSSTTSSTTSSSDGSSTTTTTTSGTTPTTTPTATPTATAPSTSSGPTTSSSAPAATPVTTESGTTSTDPDDQPAAPGQTKSVPIG